MDNKAVSKQAPFVWGLILLMLVSTSCRPGRPVSTADGETRERQPAGPPGPCAADALLVSPGDNLQTKINAAGAGATLCFRAGTYRLRRALRPRPGQTLTFAPGALLKGSRHVDRWAQDGSHWVVGSQTQSFPEPEWMREHMCGENPAACIHEDVYFDSRPLEHVLTLAELGPGEVYFDHQADKIYIADDPRGHSVEVTVAESAIKSAGNRVTIHGATIEQFAEAGIDIAANRWTITDCDIRDVHIHGIRIYRGSGHVIANTRVRHNGVIGLTAVEVNDLTVRASEFAENNYLHAGPLTGGYHEGAVKVLKSRDVVFADNWSHHNYGDGLWFDWDNHGILIEDNLLEHNTRNGLQYEASFDATVRYNTIRDNGTLWAAQGAAIYNSTSKNVDYYSNRIANNVIRSIVITWHDRGRSDEFGERQSANLSFHDNVIELDDNFQSWVGVYWGQDPRVFSSNNDFEDNTYIAPTVADRKDDRWWLWEGKDLTWDQWRAYGFDTTGSYLEK